MLRTLVISVGVIVLLLCLSADAAEDRIILEKEAVKVNNWDVRERVSAKQTVTLRIALKQPRMRDLQAFIRAISDPSSPDYRTRVLSHDELHSFTAAPEASVNAVLSWVLNAVVHQDILEHELTVHGDWIVMSMAAGDVENLFRVQLHRAVHKYGERIMHIIRSPVQYTVPSHLAKHVDYVFGLTDFPPVPAQRGNLGQDQGINVTPDVIRTLYNTSGAPATVAPGSGQAVAEFEQAYFYTTDLPIFQSKYNLPAQNVTRIIGPNKPASGYLGEATLDVEYIMATAPTIPTWVFSLGPFDLVSWSLNVTTTQGAPKIHSISWGSAESGFQTSVMEKVDSEFQKMASMGYTVFAASGDDGTGHSGIFRCDSFTPTFPATSPHVTAVGGTYLPSSGSTTESGWEKSGGGFSNVFTQPSWQQQAVSAYLQTPNLPEQKWWNASGRGIPDVSALATNFQVVIEKSVGPLSGTSAATPTFAAIVSLIQNTLYNNGDSKPLGFINPTLYAAGKVGRDVTSGENKSPPCSKGFSAATGWDAITGLGTPIQETLLTVLSGNNNNNNNKPAVPQRK